MFIPLFRHLNSLAGFLYDSAMTDLITDPADCVRAVRNGVGAWAVTDRAFLRFTGPDAATWLQSQTSNDVVALEPGQGHANAHLERKGRVIAPFTLHRWEDEYWCIVDSGCAQALKESLDAHLFIEEAEIHDSSSDVEWVAVQGPGAPMFVAGLLDDDAPASEQLPGQPYSIAPISIGGYAVFAVNLSLVGEYGYLFMTEAGESVGLLDSLLESQAMAVSTDAQEVLRIEAGRPQYGIDFDEKNRLPETTLERDAVSYEKGCYVGQEVIAKLKTYSAVKLALMGLEFDGDVSQLASETPIESDGKVIGHVTSGCFSPTLSKHIAMAYLDREHRAPGNVLNVGGADARVRVLPFVEAPAPEERAVALYDAALASFDADLEDTDTRAIELLEEAILLNPIYEDAYESLGVILHRHGRTDEAIAYMKVLAELNPDCVMAHTNLSVFYVAKGMIDEAEDEKARSSVLQLKHAADKRKAEDIARQERDRLQQEARERIEMFTEVLEFDPDDPLATFGMGQSHMQLQQYEEAVPYLEHATKVQKDYSAAYLNLGKCLEFLDRGEEAAAAYREGIRVANLKGDLMPLREMERRIAQLGG